MFLTKVIHKTPLLLHIRAKIYSVPEHSSLPSTSTMILPI